MLHHDAAILHDLDALGPETCGRCTVHDSELHPDGPGAWLHCQDLVHVLRDVIRSPEQVYEIDREPLARSPRARSSFGFTGRMR